MLKLHRSLMTLAALVALSTPARAQEKSAHLYLLLDTDKSAGALDVPAETCAFAGKLGAKTNDVVGAWSIAEGNDLVLTQSLVDAKTAKGVVAPICKLKTASRKRDVAGALDTAVGFATEDKADALRLVLLVSAGTHDASPDKTGIFSEGGALTQLHDAQIPVFTIAVGPAADKDMLAQIAAKTGGKAFEAADAAGLPKAFDDVMAKIDAARAGAALFEEPPPPEKKKPEEKKPEEKKPEEPKKPEAKVEDGDPKPTETPKPEVKKPEPKKETPKTPPKKDPPKKPKNVDDEEEEDLDDDDEEAASSSSGSDEPAPSTGFMKPWMWYGIYGLGGLLFWVIVIVMFVKWRRRRREAVEEEEAAPADNFNADQFFKGGGGGGGGSKKAAAPAPVVKARFVPMAGGADSFDIASDKEVTTLGRKAQNQIVLTHPGCSGFHAELRWDGGVLKIVDKGSTNGTFVNDQRITEKQLKPQDVLRFDTLAFRVGGQTVVPRPQAVEEDEGSGGSEKTMTISGDDPMFAALQEEAPEATTMLSGAMIEDIEAALNCSKHKNRVAQQKCEICARPYCSECLVKLQGQYLCPKCRAIPGA